MNKDSNHTSTLLIQASPEAMAVMRRFNEQKPQGLGAIRREDKQPQATGLEVVGIKGERGLNLTGVLSQVLQKSASVNNPEQAKAKMQFGLVNTIMPEYVKALKNFDIDVNKFAPDGKFRGEGGVEGLLELVDAMKAKGLENNLKSGQAGFNNNDANQFLQALMKNSDTIRSKVAAADHAAKSKQLNTDFSEVKHADFGKIKAAEIQVDKLKSPESSSKTTSVSGNAPEKLADDPDSAPTGVLSVVAGLTTALAGVSLYTNRKKGSGAKTGRFANVAGTAGVQRVFITNFPSGMPLSERGQKRQQRLAKNRAATMPGGNGKPGKGGSIFSKFGKNLSRVLARPGAMSNLRESFLFGRDVAGPVVRDFLDDTLSYFSGEETRLGLAFYDAFNREPEPTKVIVEVQNGNIVASVDEQHARNANRH